jgi:hypothetical protein
MATPTADVALEPTQPTKLAVLDKGMVLSTAEVIERTKRIREVMEAVMKPNVHYGIIPGTPKPTMFQPGADVLNVTFRIAPKVAQIDDLSNDDEVRYRILVQGVHQTTGEILADGVGECSSNEEKYRWRKSVCDEEWAETDATRRREKWAKNNQKPYKVRQVRMSPADVANTVLKIAVKRAKVAMTINATAASDVFAQDLEDLTEELREHIAEGEIVGESKPDITMPQRKTEEPAAATQGSGIRDHGSGHKSEPATAGPLHVQKVETAQGKAKVDAEGKETPGKTFYVIVLSDGRKLSTFSDTVATAADALATKKATVRLLTVAEAEKDAGVEGTSVLVYTPAPANSNFNPRLERVLG